MCGQTAERGRSGPGSRGSGCSCRPGAGVPGGPREPRPAAASAFWRRGRPLSSHDPGRSRARPAPTLARPARAQGSAGPEPAPGKPGGGRRAGGPSSLPGRTGRRSAARGRPRCPRVRVPRALGARRPSRDPREPGPGGGAGWPHSGSRRTGPDAGCRVLSGAQGSNGDLPGPPVAGVTLPRNHSVDSGLTKVLARRSKSAGRRRIPGTPCQPPAPPRARPVRTRAPARGPNGVRPAPGARASDAEPRAAGSPEGDGTLGHGGGTGPSAPARPRRGPSKAGDGGPPRCPWPGPGHERIFILG